MMSMVERVARAMCEADGFKWDAGDFCETANGETPDEQREYWLDKARAAIEAMREPTDAMVRVGRKKIPAGHGQACIYTGDAYTAMIDAALNEQVAG